MTNLSNLLTCYCISNNRIKYLTYLLNSSVWKCTNIILIIDYGICLFNISQIKMHFIFIKNVLKIHQLVFVVHRIKFWCLSIRSLTINLSISSPLFNCSSVRDIM